MLRDAFLVVLMAHGVVGACPYAHALAPQEDRLMAEPTSQDSPYVAALRKLDLSAVQDDIKNLLTNSDDDYWPADYGNYGPLFVRLAWHCSGSYRKSDGRGGCAGGRQRFDPERSWDDNTNLDKARTLLWPIKQKYGLGLSWGDLFILAGTTAMETMGAPVLGFCAGRVDDEDGTWSEDLGPTPEQEADAPCKVNGECKTPLGSTTIGLIYLNPEGPMGQPLPNVSALEIRDTFGRMGMNDTETVALIGGGHAFGKTHGACTSGAGPSPKEDPKHPWPGKCGTGKGADAFTSGIEGPWTTNPTSWDNEYFKNLLSYEWDVAVGPGGKHQWHVGNDTSPQAPGPQGGEEDIMMMTTDLGLIHDDTYLRIVQNFANDIDAFDNAFAHAWYKLTTRDMGPVTRCVGSRVPPAQPWQHPLPSPPSNLPDFDKVADAIQGVMSREGPRTDHYHGQPNNGPLFVRLAFQCASTFRVTDYLGGCNGARIRYSPEKEWETNAGLDAALDALQPVKDQFGDSLSWADLIVLAGNVALEKAGGLELPFCGGRTDASEGSGSDYLTPRITGSVNDTISDLRKTITISGLSKKEWGVLQAAGHSLGQMHSNVSGYTGSWTSDPTTITTEYFSNVLNEEWESYTVSASGKQQYKAKDKELYMLETDLMWRWDDELQTIAQNYIADQDSFLSDLVTAWTKLMTADRFKGPTGNVCA